MEIIFTNCVLSYAFSMGAMGVGLICAMVVSVSLDERPPFSTDIPYGSKKALSVFAFLLGAQACSAIFIPIRSGVTTLLMLVAMEGQVLPQCHPEWFRELETKPGQDIIRILRGMEGP
jgi:hypothetical protein